MAFPGNGPRRTDETTKPTTLRRKAHQGLRSSVRKAARRIPAAPFPEGLGCGVCRFRRHRRCRRKSEARIAGAGMAEARPSPNSTNNRGEEVCPSRSLCVAASRTAAAGRGAAPGSARTGVSPRLVGLANPNGRRRDAPPHPRCIRMPVTIRASASCSP